MDKKIGDCCISGVNGKLSFGHIPPEAAFNDRRAFEANISGLINGTWSPGERIEEGKYKQRGAGQYSLCGKCNSDTGAWYGTTYVDVARQAMYRLYRSQGNMSGLAYQYGMFPLRFLKQIAAMFCSACGPGLQQKKPRPSTLRPRTGGTTHPAAAPFLRLPTSSYLFNVHPPIGNHYDEARLATAPILRDCVSAFWPHDEHQQPSSSSGIVRTDTSQSIQLSIMGYRLPKAPSVSSHDVVSRRPPYRRRSTERSS